MAHIVTVVASKGGVGKSTIATNIAVAAELASVSSCVIDLDDQATAERWGEWRGEEAPAVIGAKAATLGRTLRQVEAAGAELIVIDNPPRAHMEARESVGAANLVLIPCRPGAFDLDAIRLTAGLVSGTGKPGFVVMNAAHPSASTVFEEINGLVTGLGLQLAPVRLCDRALFRKAGGQGRGVIEIEPEGKAAEEARNLYDWIARMLGIRTSRKRRAAA